MSDSHVPPNPDGEIPSDVPFDFAALSADVTEPIPDYEPPNVKAGKSKRKWWQSAPKTERNKRERKIRKTPPVPRGGLKNALMQMYAGLGMALMPLDPHCARVIIENAERCAESLDELAKTNPALRHALIVLVSGSAWGAVIVSHTPIFMAIMMHHIPALRERQEKMVSEFAEMFANMGNQEGGEEEK